MKLGGLNFGGPVMWFFLFLLLLAVGGAIYQSIDLALRKDRFYGRFGRIVWLPIPVLYLVALLAAYIGYYLKFKPVLTVTYGMLLFFLTVANLVQLPAYLLRVVFPTPKRAVELAERADVEPPQWAVDSLADTEQRREGTPTGVTAAAISDVAGAEEATSASRPTDVVDEDASASPDESGEPVSGA